MDTLKVGDSTYYSIEKFMLIYNLKTRKSVYNWVNNGKAIKRKIGSNAFFKKV